MDVTKGAIDMSFQEIVVRDTSSIRAEIQSTRKRVISFRSFYSINEN